MSDRPPAWGYPPQQNGQQHPNTGTPHLGQNQYTPHPPQQLGQFGQTTGGASGGQNLNSPHPPQQHVQQNQNASSPAGALHSSTIPSTQQHGQYVTNAGSFAGNSLPYPPHPLQQYGQYNQNAGNTAGVANASVPHASQQYGQHNQHAGNASGAINTTAPNPSQQYGQYNQNLGNVGTTNASAPSAPQQYGQYNHNLGNAGGVTNASATSPSHAPQQPGQYAIHTSNSGGGQNTYPVNPLQQYAQNVANRGSPAGARNPYPAHMQNLSNPGVSRGKHKRAPSDDHYDYSPAYPLIVRRKRSRMSAVTTPPAVPVVPVNDLKYPNAARWGAPGRSFNIFEALLRHPHLFHEFIMRLPPKVFIDLFATSRELNFRVTQAMTSVMQDYVGYHAKEAAFYFTWQMHPELCVNDPTTRPVPDRPHLCRLVPSFRWAQMVIHRDLVVKRILTMLAMEGHRVPEGTKEMLLKYWLLLELNTQASRERLLENPSVWTDRDFFLFYLFKIKLDMRFGHPVYGKGAGRLSVLILSQRSLNPLDQLLKGDLDITRSSLVDRVLRTYDEGDLNLAAHPELVAILHQSMPRDQWGVGSHEHFDIRMPVMLRAPLLVGKEAVRRDLDVWMYFMDFCLYGYVRPRTGLNEPYPVLLKEKWEKSQLRTPGEVTVTGWYKTKEIFLPKKGWPLERQIVKWLKELELEESSDGEEEEKTLPGGEAEDKTAWENI